MKILIILFVQLISFSLFARSPAVLPEYKIEPMNGLRRVSLMLTEKSIIMKMQDITLESFQQKTLYQKE